MNADGVIQDLQDTNAIAYTHKATDDNNNIVNLNSLLQNDYIKNILKFKKNNEAVVDLLDHITKDKEKTNDKLFIISAAYDKIYKKYYTISLSILILSSIVTLIEAFRLSIIEFINNSDSVSTDTYVISFIMNILTLTMGTVITILSSVIRFKNYRELLEQLKDKQNLLITYREKYNKKYETILNLLAIDNLTIEDVKDINEKISQYDNDVKTINILEYIRNDEFLKFNKYKAHFDFTIRKIDIDKHNAIQNYESKLKQKFELNNINKYMKIQDIKKLLWNRNNDTQS
jgi:hypothetical protein